MTTSVTKESLIARIVDLECGARSLKEDYTLAAYKMLLATMEAEPVYQFIVNKPEQDGYFEWADCNPDFYSKEPSDRRRILYTAHIAPLYRHAQPVVPDGLVKAVEFYEQVKHENPPVETGAWRDAVDWVLKEACRAAMLNQK